MKNFLFVVSLISLILLGGCRDDFMVGEPNETPLPNPNPTEVPIFFETEVSGRVVNLDGQGVENAIVTVGSTSLTTDPFGFYDSGTILAPSTGLYVKATKDGYFVGGSQYNPTEEITQTFVIVTLLEYDSPSAFASSSGISMSLPDGANLQIPENGFARNGQEYNGQVIVNMTWLDPTEVTTQRIHWYGQSFYLVEL